jgi:nitrogen fixation NifU-like protein
MVMAYSKKVLDHYENPRNVGSFNKEDANVGTGMVGAPACLHGDTLVALADGRRCLSIRELAQIGDDVPVYTWGANGYQIENGYKPRLTRKSAHCIKIIFDDGSFVVGTDDHELYRYTGNERKKHFAVPFSALKVGDSVRPFSRGLNKIAILTSNPKILSIEDYGYSDVYCLTTEYNGCFAVVTSPSDSLDSGVLVSNCGDVMRLQIKVNSDGVIEDAVFKTYGCGSAIASSSLVTEWVKGKTLEQAGQITNNEIVTELELPPVKIHCSVLAEDAIKAAITDYKNKSVTGLSPVTEQA